MIGFFEKIKQKFTNIRKKKSGGVSENEIIWNEYFEQISIQAHEILEMAEEEIKKGEASKWNPKLLKNVICEEMHEILDSLSSKEDFEKFRKSRRILYSSYYIMDSMDPIQDTLLAERVYSLSRYIR